MFRAPWQPMSLSPTAMGGFGVSYNCHQRGVLADRTSSERSRGYFGDFLRSLMEEVGDRQFEKRDFSEGDTETEDIADRIRRTEAVLFISREPLTTRRLAQLAGLADATEARTLIRQLNDRYEKAGRAFRIEEVGGGFELLTKPQFAPWLRRLGHVPQEERLTSAAIETLAIVAYRQPVMRVDIEAIRGVGSEEVLKQLLSRDLVRICGRSEELGRPYLYGTTKRFLKMFGLRSLEKLPRAEWINQPWDAEEPNGDTADSRIPISPRIGHNRSKTESAVGLQESQDLVDNPNREDQKVISVDLQPSNDAKKESIVKLANSAIGLAFESEESLEEQLAVASRLAASSPVAVDDDEDEEFEDEDEEFEDEDEDEDFDEFEDDEEDLDEDLEEDEDFDDAEDDEESFDDDEEEEWEEVEEEEEGDEEEDEESDWDDEEEDDDWDDDDEEEEEEEDEDWE
ncbi:MAG: Segregation and condensation protein [Planctomycetota bacterium]